jgi:hypothetical protein
MPTLKINVDDRQMRMLNEMAAKYGGTPESGLEQLLVLTISNAYFVEIAAARDYFEDRPPVSREEAEKARDAVAVPILDSASGLRDEAAMYGLLLGAWELALKICRAAGYVYAGQHAEQVVKEFTQTIIDHDPRTTEVSPPE